MSHVGLKTRRYKTDEFLQLFEELGPRIQQLFNTKVHLISFYNNKETHGDMDLLLLNDGTLGNIREKLALEFEVSDEILKIAYNYTKARKKELHEVAEEKAQQIINIIKTESKVELFERVEAGIKLIIMDKILRIAVHYEDITTSDLQSMAEAEAMNIIAMIKNFINIK